MAFVVRQTLTWEDWDAWNQSYIINHSIAGGAVRSADTIQRFFGGVLIIIGICTLGAALSSGKWIRYALLALAIIAAGLLFLRPGTSLRKRTFRRSANRILKEYVPDTPTRAVFRDDEFQVWSSAQEQSWSYSAAVRVWEDRDRFYFLPEDGSPLLILRKSALPPVYWRCFGIFCKKRSENLWNLLDR